MIPLPHIFKTLPNLTLTALWFLVLSAFCNPTIAEETKNDNATTKHLIPPKEKISDIKLKKLLIRHQEWLKIYNTTDKRKSPKAYRDPRYVNLNGKDLTNLFTGNLNFTYVDLIRSDLSLGEFGGYADFAYANLQGTVIEKGGFNNANFSYANMKLTNLNSTIFRKVNFTGAHLKNTNFNNITVLENANFLYAIFEPAVLPPVDSIAQAENLETMVYLESPQALVKLRKAFKETGYREQERAITHAINQSGLWRDKDAFSRIEDSFKFVFFNLPTQWGMYPGRALRILLAGIFVFMAFYLVALRKPNEDAGIWKMRPEKRERLREKEKLDSELIRPKNLSVAMKTAFYFSILSAFHIGWRDLNVGGWISRLQGKEYTLRATGWVRTVSGIQSLIGVYLVAMWVLTYFGRPFG